jgi:asparagine synthase (glutamine-hydrolysing)
VTVSWLLRWDTVADVAPRVRHSSLDASPAGTSAGSNSFALFDGYLFDRAELALDATASDAALVLSAHDRWRDAMFEKLRGGFTAAVWDEQQRRLTVGRDATGLHPCFYWWNGRVFLVSPSLDALLSEPEVSRRFNRAVVAEYVRDRMPLAHAHETFYEGVCRLRPAHALCLSGRRLSISRYWDPVPPGFSWAGDEERARFVPVLESAVKRCLSVGADSLALSGGFDSVSIAVLASGQARRAPLHAVSLRLDNTVCDEGETQTAVARALGMRQLLLTRGDSLGDASFVESALEASSTSPSPVLSPWQSMYTALLRSAADRGLARMLMGTGGDEMFAVDLAYGADCLAALDVSRLWHFFRTLHRASPFSMARVARVVLWDGAVSPHARRLARTMLDRVSPRGLAWLRHRRQERSASYCAAPADPRLALLLEERASEEFDGNPAQGDGAYVRALRRLIQSPLLLIEQDQAHAWAGRFGFTLLYPYFDRDLVDLSLRVHPEHLMAGGWSKAPLRRLVAERLPMVPLPPRKVDFTQAVHEVLRSEGRRMWRRLRGAQRLDELGIVDRQRADPLMEDYFAARSSSWVRAWLLLGTEAWLRTRTNQPFTPHDREVLA